MHASLLARNPNDLKNTFLHWWSTRSPSHQQLPHVRGHSQQWIGWKQYCRRQEYNREDQATSCELKTKVNLVLKEFDQGSAIDQWLLKAKRSVTFCWNPERLLLLSTVTLQMEEKWNKNSRRMTTRCPSTHTPCCKLMRKKIRVMTLWNQSWSKLNS